MAEDSLYTLRQISQELDLPESTIRYYRDSFAEYLPTVGTGRRRRYPPKAFAMLRVVAEGYANNRGRSEIETQLRGMPGEPIDAEPLVSFDVGSEDNRAVDDEWIPKYIDGERERRDAMWHMAREIVRLGEAIDRQQVMMGELAKQLSESASRTLPVPQAQPAQQHPDPVATPQPQTAAATTQPAPDTAPTPEAVKEPLVTPPPVHSAPVPPPQPQPVPAVDPAVVEHAAEVGPEPQPEPPRAAPAPGHTATAAAGGRQAGYGSELGELREQLSRERELVERLRRSKLEIERRAADAEYRLGDGAAEAPRRSSVFKRLFNRD